LPSVRPTSVDWAKAREGSVGFGYKMIRLGLVKVREGLIGLKFDIQLKSY